MCLNNTYVTILIVCRCACSSGAPVVRSNGVTISSFMAIFHQESCACLLRKIRNCGVVIKDVDLVFT